MGFIVDIKGNLVKYIDIFNKKTNLIIPSRVKNICDKAFFSNANIQTVEMSSNVKTIGAKTFFKCKNLNKVIFTKCVSDINSECFSNCSNLREIEGFHGVVNIGDKAFSDCYKLVKIKFPKTLKTLGKSAFSNCRSFTSVVLPKGIVSIGEGCFWNCYRLNSVTFPSLFESIEEETFKDCMKLDNVVWPANLKNIGKRAFEGCAFTTLNFPDTLESIGLYAFSDNKNLKRFSLPDTIVQLNYEAFSQCHSVRNFKIGPIEFKKSDLIELEDDSIIEKIYLPNVQCDESLFYKLDLSPRNQINPISNSIIISTIFTEKELLQRKEIAYIMPFIAGKYIDASNYKLIKNELLNNYKDFSRFIKKVIGKEQLAKSYSNRLSVYDLYKLAHVLGAFSDDSRTRQRACEFLTLAFESGQLNILTVHGLLENLQFQNYNPEIAEFLMNKDNWNEMLLDELDNDKKGYLVNVINEFSKIREFARSNRGSQSYRKITLKIVDLYFSSKEFEGIDSYNEDISVVLFPYTHEQETFQEAIEIKKKYEELRSSKKVYDHILHEELSSKILESRRQILENSREIVDNLSKVANQQFTFEYLSKADPKNYVLGKYCSCCAHLEGAGRSIVKASILHPDCQNLVIKDKNGRIIAKSTLYINRQQGYGVFNNMEVSEQVDDSMKKYIYECYKEAAREFALRYNELNSKRPITQINVGMLLNDLEPQIVEHDLKDEEMLKGFNFYEYGNYSGDWWLAQYILWKDENIEKENEKNPKK